MQAVNLFCREAHPDWELVANKRSCVTETARVSDDGITSCTQMHDAAIFQARKYLVHLAAADASHCRPQKARLSSPTEPTTKLSSRATSCPHDRWRSAAIRQESLAGASPASRVQYIPLPPGGLMIPAMWPLEARTNRTSPLKSCVMRQAASQGTMWSFSAPTA